MPPVLVSNFTATSCIGRGAGQTLRALLEGRSGLRCRGFENIDASIWVGEVEAVDDEIMEPEWKDFDCRNNRLAQMALLQDGFVDAVEALAGKWGRKRVGVFLGTSTAGMLETEQAFRHLDPQSGLLPGSFVYAATHSPFGLTTFIQGKLGLEGPSMSVSSACSSSAKVLSSAKRMLDNGFIDAAIVGGVDSLCDTTLYGFNSLGLLADGPCTPFSGNHHGISLGEAAAYLLLERMPDNLDSNAVLLVGTGESSDAFHMSSPHPEGLGAGMAMQKALSSAGLFPENVSYINLHGTATINNDISEAKAVSMTFGDKTACSSTKGATGHTLGAAGALEAVISVLSIQNDLMPAGPTVENAGAGFGIGYLQANRRQGVTHVLSNSFGFGGSNCSLIFSRAG